jgi:hypothetical protein
MQIEAVSEMDSIQDNHWNAKEDTIRWNGRDLNAVHGKQQEGRISSVALQRAHFNQAQTGYILCKSEKDSNSGSESKSSNDKSSKSDSDSQKSDVKQQVTVGGKYNSDNHGHSSNEAHGKYKASIQFENGTSLDVEGTVGFERHVDRGELSDRTSGEIDASYNF